MPESRIFRDVWRRIFRAFGFRETLKHRVEIYKIKARSFKGQSLPVFVVYDFHRYFWTATSGKDTKKVITDIVLN